MPALASSSVGSFGISGLDGTSRWSRSTKKSVNRRRISVDLMCLDLALSDGRWPAPSRAGRLARPAPRLGEASSQLRPAPGHAAAALLEGGRPAGAPLGGEPGGP